MGVGATLIFEFGYYLINSIVFNFDIEILSFVKIILIEILYNTLVLIIIYPLFQKIGYMLDRKFKKSNLLTRYF